MRLVTIPLLKSRYDASFFVTKLEPYEFINFPKYIENDENIHNTNEIVINNSIIFLKDPFIYHFITDMQSTENNNNK